jgi:hypothetical protein
MHMRLIPLVAALILFPARSPDRAADAPEPEALALLDLTQLEKGLPTGWELEENEGKVDVLADGKGPRDGRSWVRVEGEENQRALSLYCRKASFSLNRDLGELDLDGHSILEWEWQATQLPEGADMRKSKRNDQVLQVLVQLDTTAKKVISYVWDTTAPEGATASESYAMGLYKVKVLCVESGAESLGAWQTVRRDLRADYKKLYGSDDFPGVAGIRIQSNSQYTKGTGAGAVRRLDFLPTGAAGAR